jgi:hypothetical protein
MIEPSQQTCLITGLSQGLLNPQETTKLVIFKLTDVWKVVCSVKSSIWVRE